MRTTSSLRLPLRQVYEDGRWKVYDADAVLIAVIGNEDMDTEQEEAWASEILEAVNGRDDLQSIARIADKLAAALMDESEETTSVAGWLDALNRSLAEWKNKAQQIKDTTR